MTLNDLCSRNRQGKVFETPLDDLSDVFHLNPRRWIAFLMSQKKFPTFRTLCKEFNNLYISLSIKTESMIIM